MSTSTAPKTPELLTPDGATKLVLFARACKAAARAVTLYPASHPSVTAALSNIIAASAAPGGPFSLLVTSNELLFDGRRLERPDLSVVELAVLLHGHAVGELTIDPATDVQTWRTFLLLIGEPADDVRGRGGIGRVWGAEQRPGITVREIDYGHVLKDRSRGDTADWTAVVANCLQGDAVEIDDHALEILLDMLHDPDRLQELTVVLQERAGGSAESGGTALATLLAGIAGVVAREHPERLDGVYTEMADAACRLSVDTFLTVLGTGPRGPGSSGAAGVTQTIDLGGELIRRMSSDAVAEFVAKSIVSGQGASARLAEAFQALVPGESRQLEVLDLAEQTLATPIAQEQGFEDVWKRARQMLLAYSDRRYVSEHYDRELARARSRAVELEQTSEDPADLLQAWMMTIDEPAVRALDAQLLLDLLEVETSALKWRELSEVAAIRINDLVILGDFASAQRLAASLGRHRADDADASRQQAASDAIEQLLAGPVMRHVASQFETLGDAVFDEAKTLCYTLGTMVIRPLAEVLANEQRGRARQRMRDLLLGFGAAGRQSVEQLKQSPNPSVRRTAIYLLREFGGNEALPELESLLDDAEAHVQREAIRAIVALGLEAGYATLERALSSGSARSRSAIMNTLTSLRDDRAGALFAYIVHHTSHRGAMAVPYRLVVESLGRHGGPEGIEALKEALQRGEWWAPIRTAALRTAIATALARLGTPDALAVLEEAASDRNRGVRKIARAQLAGATKRRVDATRPR